MKKVVTVVILIVFTMLFSSCNSSQPTSEPPGETAFPGAAQAPVPFVDNDKALPNSGKTYNYPYTTGVLHDWNVEDENQRGLLTDDGSFETSGIDGLALFGPYAQCKSGTYNFTLHYSVLENPNNAEIVGVFDITTGMGSTLVSHSDLPAGNSSVTLENISFETSTDTFEHRVWTTNGAKLKIIDIEIIRTDSGGESESSDLSYTVDFDNSLPEEGIVYNYPHTYGVSFNLNNTAPNGFLDSDGTYVVRGPEAGLAIFGPFADCKSGTYKFTLIYEVIDNPNNAETVGKFDVVSQYGAHLLDEIPLPADSTSVTLESITFSNQDDIFEHRVWTNQDAQIRIISFSIEKVS